MLYYVLVFILVVSSTYWHFCIYLFFLAEIIIFLVRPFFSLVWLLRILMAAIFINAINTNYSEYADIADAIIVYNIHRFSFYTLSIEFLCVLTSSVVDIHTLLDFGVNYFLVLYFPYYLECLIIFLPLLSSILLLSTGYLIGYVYAGYLACGFSFVSALSALFLWLVYPNLAVSFLRFTDDGLLPREFSFRPSISDPHLYTVAKNDSFVLEYTDLSSNLSYQLLKESLNFNLSLDFGNFIDTPFFVSKLEFVVDSISIVMVSAITIISFLVHLYSTAYMREDPHITRFFALLSLFTFFMVMLVTAGNLVILYVG